MRAGDQFALGQTEPQGGPESQELGGFAADDEPYPGLRAFRRDETHIFFGREEAVNEMASYEA